MSSPAMLPVKVPPIGVLTLKVSSANLGLAILSPVITILRDDFSASVDRAQLVISAFMLSVVGSAITAPGGADHFSVTAIGLLITALCAALSSFLAPNSR